MPIQIDPKTIVWMTLESNVPFPFRRIIRKESDENLYEWTDFKFEFRNDIEDNLFEASENSSAVLTFHYQHFNDLLPPSLPPSTCLHRLIEMTVILNIQVMFG